MNAARAVEPALADCVRHALARAARPRTRAECAGGPRPCPWVSCQHHLLPARLEGEAARGLNDDGAVELLASMPVSCVLDALDAEPDGLQLEAVGEMLDVTRERVRQIEGRALRHARWPMRRDGFEQDLAEEPDALDAMRARREARGVGVVARPAEGPREPAPAPPRYAHLPGFATVAAGREFWCGRLGAAVTTALCARRATARTRMNDRAGTHPTYRACAECPDGAALRERLGDAALTPPPRRHLTVIHVTASAPPPALTPTEIVMALDRSKKPPPPAPASTTATATAQPPAPAGDVPPSATATGPDGCVAKGCEHPRGERRSNTDPNLAELCIGHRPAARGLMRAHDLTAAQAVEKLRNEERKAYPVPGRRVVPKPAKPSRPAKAAPTAARVARPSGDPLEPVKRIAAAVHAVGGVEALERLVPLVRRLGGVDQMLDYVSTVDGLLGRS